MKSAVSMMGMVIFKASNSLMPLYYDYTYDGPLVKSVIRRSKDKKDLYSYEVANRDLMGHTVDEILVQFAGAQRQNWDQSGKEQPF